MDEPLPAAPEESEESLRLRLEEYERRFRTLDEQMRVLERERQKLSAIVHQTDAGFLVMDSTSSVVWANSVFARRFLEGPHPGAIIGQPCNRVLCDREEICAACPAAAPFRTGRVAHHEMRLEAGGRVRHIYATAMPIKSLTGEIDQTMVMLQDVSNLEVLRQSQEALRNSEERFRSIFESAAAGMATVAPDGQFLQVNPALCRLLGYSEEELLARKVPEITHPEDRSAAGREFAEAASSPRRVVDTERRYLRKDGSIAWGHITAALLLDSRGVPAYWVALVQDIGDRKQAEDTLQHREEQLRQSQKMEAIGTLAGGVAHDFNNILTGILGYAELLKMASTPGERVHLAAEGHREGRHPRGLAHPAASGIRAQGEEQERSGGSPRHDPGGAGASGRRLEPGNHRPPGSLRGDPVGAGRSGPAGPGDSQSGRQRRRCHAGRRLPDLPDPGGGARVASGPARARHRAGRHVLLTVTDTGFGIPEEVRGRIFDPFFTTKQDGRGTGMGLAMVYGIVHNHGGLIEADSEVGRGTTFSILLPLTQPGPEGERRKPRPEPIPGTGRILVVDDEETVRNVAGELLQEPGLRGDHRHRRGAGRGDFPALIPGNRPRDPRLGDASHGGGSASGRSRRFTRAFAPFFRPRTASTRPATKSWKKGLPASCRSLTRCAISPKSWPQP